jgi:hypothetical protein
VLVRWLIGWQQMPADGLHRRVLAPEAMSSLLFLRREDGSVSRYRSRARRPLVLLGVSAVLANAGLVLGLHAAFPGLSLFPSSGEPAAQEQVADPVVREVAQRGGPLPAESVLASVFASEPGALPGAGWQAASDPGGALGTPFDFACGAPMGAAPALVETRGWSQVNGPLPGNLNAAVTVSLRGYGAGAGAAAFEALEQSLRDCAGASRGGWSGLGVEAMTARSGQTAALVWREGDVLGQVTYQAAGAPGDLSAVAALAAEYDRRLVSSLTGTCVTVTSTLADASRSPYIDRAAYTGYAVPHEVRLDPEFQASTTAAATPALAPDMVSVPEVPIPSPERVLPSVGVLPKKPADPVEPAALPVKVDRPVAPVPPVEAPTSKDVPELVADPQGPGCGWKFTGQVAPPFDASAAKTALAADMARGQQELQADWQTWLAQRRDYFAAYAAYQQQADAFTAYAAEVDVVRTAWAAVDARRATYAAAVKRYEDAAAAREKFLADQRTAQAEFDAAVTACAVASSAPVTPSPSDTPSATPTTSAAPTGAPSLSPSPEATSSAAPTTPAPVCPAPRPAVLDQQAPPVPQAPAPLVEAPAGN